MQTQSDDQNTNSSILGHYLYELRKGVRKMALHTTHANRLPMELARIQRHHINYLVLKGNNNRMNVLLGNQECLDVIASFQETNLSLFSIEQDFILGILLGYGMEQQCQRYLGLSEKRQQISTHHAFSFTSNKDSLWPPSQSSTAHRQVTQPQQHKVSRRLLPLLNPSS